MNNKTNHGVHWSFWLIGVVGLLWNVGGAINYIMQMDSVFVASLPATHQAIIDGRPVWATAGFALGVFAGAFGCLLLLLKKLASKYLLIGSLVGIVVTIIHTVMVANSKIEFSLAEIIVMIILPMIVAALLLWYITFSINKGWLD